MKIEIRARGLELTDDWRERAERRAGFALDRWGDAVASVDFLIADRNGPRGGVDKACVVVIRGRRGWSVRAGADSDDVGAAIDAAMDRAARAVARHEDRRLQLRDRGSAAGETNPAPRGAGRGRAPTAKRGGR